MEFVASEQSCSKNTLVSPTFNKLNLTHHHTIQPIFSINNCVLQEIDRYNYALSFFIFNRHFLLQNAIQTEFQPTLRHHNEPVFSCFCRQSTHAFSPQSALQTLKTLLSSQSHEAVSPDFKILPFRKGRPLAGSGSENGHSWHLGWLSLGECRGFLENSEVGLSEDSLVYLGCRYEDDIVYWAIDVSDSSGLVCELGEGQFCFVKLRTLMVATDWADAKAMGELCHCRACKARALLEWHNLSRFCGSCRAKAVPMEAGRRKQCANELCKKRFYPRVDPVVIMLVIDKENDRVLLSRQSRYVPRMWICFAGFIEVYYLKRVRPHQTIMILVLEWMYVPKQLIGDLGSIGNCLVRKRNVGPSSMPCQLMVGFFAYAKSVEIHVDKEELEDAKWHSRADIKKFLTYAEYKKAQKNAAAKVEQMCKGVEKGQQLSADFNIESGELAPMFIPGPFAIAHHLITSWVSQVSPIGIETQKQEARGSQSNL